MPNHVINVVTFCGDEEKINALLEKIKGEDSVIDFGKIIPMPAKIFRGDLGQKERELYGADNWYDWSILHWGTKWNAYDTSRNGSTITFSTAWSMPNPIYERLSEMCMIDGITFSGGWCNEDWMGDSGEFVCDENGFSAFDDESEEEHASRCADLWGYDPNEEERY